MLSFLSFRRAAGLLGLALLLPLRAPAQQAEAWLVADATSGHVLASQRPRDKRQVASLTKVASAIVVLDLCELKKATLDDRVAIPAGALGANVSNPIGFQAGDLVTVRDLLLAMMLQSDNVAATALARHFGAMLPGEGNVGPEQRFVQQMNALAAALGMDRTLFLNPHGFDSDNVRPYSTAQDMGRLARRAMDKAPFRFLVTQKERRIAIERPPATVPPGAVPPAPGSEYPAPGAPGPASAYPVPGAAAPAPGYPAPGSAPVAGGPGPAMEPPLAGSPPPAAAYPPAAPAAPGAPQRATRPGAPLPAVPTATPVVPGVAGNAPVTGPTPAGPRRLEFLLRNTNELLGRMDVDGVKTGQTARAGGCVILTAHRPPLTRQIDKDKFEIKPRKLVVVILGSPNRFGDGQALIQRGWALLDQWMAAGRPMDNVKKEITSP